MITAERYSRLDRDLAQLGFSLRRGNGILGIYHGASRPAFVLEASARFLGDVEDACLSLRPELILQCRAITASYL